MHFDHLENTFRKYLVLDHNPNFLPLVCGTVIANRLDSKPVWMVVMGRASSGKSQVIDSLSKAPETHVIAQLTDKSLASGANMSAPDMKGKDEPSLLAHINNKILVVRDASMLSSMRSDKKGVLFSQLRTAYDGEFELSTGVETKKFKAKFGFIMAATPAFQRQFAAQSELGERWLFFRLRPESEDRVEEQMEANAEHGTSFIAEKLSGKMARFLNQCSTPKKVRFHPKIKAMAKSLIVLRTHVHKDEGFEINEEPYRVMGQLAALFTGVHAVIEDETRAINIIRKVARNSIIPYSRAQVIRAVLRGSKTQAAVARSINFTDAGVKKVVEDLVGLGVIKQFDDPDDKKQKFLQVNEKHKELFKIGMEF